MAVPQAVLHPLSNPIDTFAMTRAVLISAFVDVLLAIYIVYTKSSEHRPDHCFGGAAYGGRNLTSKRATRHVAQHTPAVVSRAALAFILHVLHGWYGALPPLGARLTVARASRKFVAVAETKLLSIDTLTASHAFGIQHFAASLTSTATVAVARHFGFAFATAVTPRQDSEHPRLAPITTILPLAGIVTERRRRTRDNSTLFVAKEVDLGELDVVRVAV